MKIKRHFNFIISYLGDCISFSWQLQYYQGDKYLEEKHWSLGLGLYFPPWLVTKGGSKP